VHGADPAGDVEVLAVHQLVVDAGRVGTGVRQAHDQPAEHAAGEERPVRPRGGPVAAYDRRVGRVYVDRGVREADDVLQAAHVVAVVVRDQDRADVRYGAVDLLQRRGDPRSSLRQSGIDEGHAIVVNDGVRVDVTLEQAIQTRNDLEGGHAGYKMGR
jgi:hypothetical protein